MATLTIRNVRDEVHRALRLRAAERGRSAEAEVRDILERSLLAEDRVKLGSLLAEIGREVGLTDEEFEAFVQRRDKAPAKPIAFE